MTTGNIFTETPIAYDLMLLLAVQGKAREPILRTSGFILAPNGAPSNVNAGVDVSVGGGTLLAQVGLRLQRSPSSFRSWYRVDNAGGGDYGVQFGTVADGFKVSVPDAGTPPATAAALLAALEADANFAAIGGTVAVNASNSSLLELSTTSRVGVRVGVNGLEGSPNASAVCEATFCRWRLWALFKHKTTGGDYRQWAVVGAPMRRSDEPLRLQPESTAGIERLAVEVLAADGAVLPIIGPAPREDYTTALRDDAAKMFDNADAAVATFPSTMQGAGITADVFTQGRVMCEPTGTLLLAANPFRSGFVVRNEGLDPVVVSWISAGEESPSLQKLTLNAGEIRIQNGAPRAALVGISTLSPVEVYVEEW